MANTKEDLINAFYLIDGCYHTNVFEIINLDEEEDLLNQAIFDMLLEGEVLFVYNDDTTDNSTGFIFYKSEGKILNEFVYKKDEKFVIMSSLCSWSYPKYQDLSKKEKAKFLMQTEKYISYNSLPISFDFNTSKGIEVIYKQSERDINQLSGKKVLWIKVLAYFWRYGIIACVIPAMYLGRIVTKSRTGVLLGLSSIMMIMGLYYLLGYIFKFRHIYCVFQNANHEKMSPNEIYWNTLSKKDLIGVPILLICIGVAGLILSLLYFTGIIVD